MRGLIVRPSNSAIRCLNLGNAASILVPKTSRLTSRSSCAPDHEVKSLLVYGIQLAPSNKTDTACQSSVIVSSHVSPSSLSSTQIAVALIFKTHPIMHKAFTRHYLSDAIKTLGVEVKAYARTARDNAYIVARGFAPRTSATSNSLIRLLGDKVTRVPTCRAIYARVSSDSYFLNNRSPPKVSDSSFG